MKKYIILLLFSMALITSGCQKNAAKDKATGNQPSKNAITYDCQGEIVKVDFYNDQEPQIAQLFFVERNNKNIILPIVPTGSGAKYSDGDVAFWTHQGEAMLSMEDPSASINCMIKKENDQRQFLDNYGNAVTDGCQNWFDGCNSCKVGVGNVAMACTKKFCEPESIIKAHCLD